MVNVIFRLFKSLNAGANAVFTRLQEKQLFLKAMKPRTIFEFDLIKIRKVLNCKAK